MHLPPSTARVSAPKRALTATRPASQPTPVTCGGGNAGHNGLKDITAKLGTPNFWRLRIGIGHPRVFCPQQQVYDWVLGTPSPEHKAAIHECLEAALKTVELWAAGDEARVERMLRKYANPPKKPAAETDSKTDAKASA
mgnify:CR=1 FL=1